ncbi:MAG: bifunctional folylpolyglutamate synthase/dihydrofolate synthase [Magnetovibrio sp.]|nr:bifunctional folylpolyglutamate synthase/dihydrofolate synthase [Magnetovibrio sp.]
MLKISKESEFALQQLSKLHPKRIDLSLERVFRLLERLSNPEKNLPPVVHIAGTNGKGSVLAHLQAIIVAAGYKVHSYTSPHLVRFNERIQVAGKNISDSALASLIKECKEANAGEPITFFEFTTVAAILKFSRVSADIVLLETGLGGRLDATNVIEKPLLSIITPISLDHQQFLGESIEQISFEKAGILKSGTLCIVGPQPPEALEVIQEQAKKIGARLARFGIEWSYQKGKLPPSALPGEHQRINSLTAIIAANYLKHMVIRHEDILIGLKTVNWPARIQRLARGALVDLLPEGWELWLDGGHNEAAGKVLSVHATKCWSERPLHLIVGMLNSKHAGNFLSPLSSQVKRLWAIPIPEEENSLTASELTYTARTVGFSQVKESSTVLNALRAIIKSEKKCARVLICGSLYLAGTVLKSNS